MATDAGYAKYVCDQLANAGGITTLKMFGEYGLYRHGKIVALICDNQVFVKPTAPGEAILGTPTYGQAYPGSKEFFNVSDLLDDPERLVRLIIATDEALPAPKKKAAKKAAKPATKPSAPARPAAPKDAAKKTARAKPAAKKSAPKKSAPKKLSQARSKKPATKRPAAKK